MPKLYPVFSLDTGRSICLPWPKLVRIRTYLYDYGDSWNHKLRLERIVDQAEVMFKVPRCIAGGNACPPEDCGSFPGFQELKEVIADPEHEEYERMIQWLNGYYPNYDPEEFSLGEVNKLLKIGAGKYLRISAKFYE